MSSQPTYVLASKLCDAARAVVLSLSSSEDTMEDAMREHDSLQRAWNEYIVKMDRTMEKEILPTLATYEYFLKELAYVKKYPTETTGFRYCLDVVFMYPRMSVEVVLVFKDKKDEETEKAKVAVSLAQEFTLQGRDWLELPVEERNKLCTVWDGRAIKLKNALIECVDLPSMELSFPQWDFSVDVRKRLKRNAEYAEKDDYAE